MGNMLYSHHHVPQDCMRRALVIVLVLLFPLNVFALSMSASLFQAVVAPETADVSTATSADSQPDEGFVCEAACDLDPDEPPGHQDLHDIVTLEAALQTSAPADRTAARHDACRARLSIAPPVKPPRA